MYLHLGNDYLVEDETVIAILNLEPPLPASLQEVIELGFAERRMTRICERGREKSLIITDSQLYLSPISSTTLQKRANEPYKEG